MTNREEKLEKQIETYTEWRPVKIRCKSYWERIRNKDCFERKLVTDTREVLRVSIFIKFKF